MDNIINSLIAIANGFLAGGQELLNPWVGLVIIILVSHLWLGVVEIEDLGRSSRKPSVRRH